MVRNGRFVKNYNLINCYVDTSYVQFPDGSVIISGFSSDDNNSQEVYLTDTLRITANDGYVFDLDNLENYSFEIQFQGNPNIVNEGLPFVKITLADFEPMNSYGLEGLKSSGGYMLYQNIPTENSMVYYHTRGDYDFAILLYGGIRSNDLLFIILEQSDNGNYTLDGVNYRTTELLSGDFFNANTGNYDAEYSFLNNIDFVAVAGSEEPIEDTSKYLFNTYYIDNSDLSLLANESIVSSEIIGNTYSYPINFNEDDLIDTDFKVVGISQDLEVKRFLKNLTKVKIFEFDVPDISNVSESYINIPFNNEVKLNFDEIKGTTLSGFFIYEILTNSTTLKILANDVIVYHGIIGVGVDMPFRPSGQLIGEDVKITRLALESPILYIKGVGKHVKGNYLKGFISLNKSYMLDSEKILLDELIKEGVFIDG